MAQSKKAIQREVFHDAFEALGGIERLIQWANDVDDKGNSNYKEFIKLFTKLVPPIKKDSKEIESHESFIKMLMREEKKRLSELGQPFKLIDAIETQSQ